MNKLKAFWNSLPHQVQAVIVAFLSGGLAALAHDLSEPGACFTLACLKHLIPTFVTAGIVAAKGFYLLPSNTPLEQHKPFPPQNQPPSQP